MIDTWVNSGSRHLSAWRPTLAEGKNGDHDRGCGDLILGTGSALTWQRADWAKRSRNVLECGGRPVLRRLTCKRPGPANAISHVLVRRHAVKAREDSRTPRPGGCSSGPRVLSRFLRMRTNSPRLKFARLPNEFRVASCLPAGE